jgi:hypothetical protein
MDALGTYAACAAVIGALMVFSTLVLLGVRIVLWLKLPQEPPDEVRFEPPPPPMRPHADRADAMVVAARQAKLREIHGRGLAATQFANACREVAVAAKGRPELGERAAAIAERAKRAAEAADQARTQEGSDEATARHLAEADAAWREAEVLARELPGSSRQFWLLLAVGVLVLAWLVAIISLRHGLGPESVPG